MKVHKVNQIKKSDVFFENLVDRNFKAANKEVGFSDKQRILEGKSEFDNKNKFEKINEDFVIFQGDLPELIRPEKAASILGISLKTVYDWRYRCKQRKIPETLFLKVNRLLLIRTSVLKTWIASQNPSLNTTRNESG